MMCASCYTHLQINLATLFRSARPHWVVKHVNKKKQHWRSYAPSKNLLAFKVLVKEFNLIPSLKLNHWIHPFFNFQVLQIHHFFHIFSTSWELCYEMAPINHRNSTPPHLYRKELQEIQAQTHGFLHLKSGKKLTSWGRLVVDLPLFTKVSKISQVVVWDFWTINSIKLLFVCIFSGDYKWCLNMNGSVWCINSLNKYLKRLRACKFCASPRRSPNRDLCGCCNTRDDDHTICLAPLDNLRPGLVAWATGEIIFSGKNAITKYGGVPYRFGSFLIWIMGHQLWGVPYRLWRFPEPLPSSRQLLTTCSCTNFVGYSYQYHATPTWNIVKSSTL